MAVEYWAYRNPPVVERSPKKMPTLMLAPASYRHVNPTGVPFSGTSYRPRLRRKAGPLVGQLKARIAKVERIQALAPRRRPRKAKGTAKAARPRKNPPRNALGRFLRSGSRKNTPRRSSGRRRNASSTVILMPRKTRRRRNARGSGGRFIRGRRNLHRRRRNPPEGTGLRALMKVDTWMQVGQGAAGFAAAFAGPLLVVRATGDPSWNQGWKGVGVSAASSVGAAWLTGMVSKRAARNVLIGGLLATAIRGIIMAWPQAAAWFGMAPSAPASRAPSAPGGSRLMPSGEGGGRLRDYLTNDIQARGARDYADVLNDYADVLHGDDMDGDEMDGTDYLTVGESSTYSARESL
jgi:hypothetical protein